MAEVGPFLEAIINACQAHRICVICLIPEILSFCFGDQVNILPVLLLRRVLEHIDAWGQPELLGLFMCKRTVLLQ